MARVPPLRQPIATATGPLDLLRHLAEFWRRRDLLWHMTVRHLRGQYKQSVLGYAWAFLNPLTLLLTLSFVFSVLLRFPSQGLPYALFVLVGLLPWMFFANGLTTATDSVSGAMNLVTKVYFPREILPMAAINTKIVDLFFGLIILAGLMMIYNHPPTETMLWVPLLFGIQLIFTAGLAFPMAALNVYFHDVRYLVGVVLTMWFYLTPVIYPVEIVPSKYQFIFDLNPMAILVNAYRRVILLDDSPAMDRLLLGLGIAVVTFVVGYFLFKRMEAGFADRI
ncbi:MAG: ABC transporter permease [Chloroflexi bacterium]|nr:ABC transporter permease [Chloroflexota bacterium]MCI0815170.1 ABC transporter permease [Chloroflexota bacterium]